jgi:class 3 adenylate cyclase
MAEVRKLAAILAADVVGFTRLAGANEDRTLARLRALRSDLIDPTISVHNGRWGSGRISQRGRRRALRHRSDVWRKAQQHQHVGWTEAAGA